MMFFCRSQREPDWQGPPYKFTRAQTKAWKRLVKEVELVIEGESEGESEEEEVGMTVVYRVYLKFCIALLN